MIAGEWEQIHGVIGPHSFLYPLLAVPHCSARLEKDVSWTVAKEACKAWEDSGLLLESVAGLLSYVLEQDLMYLAAAEINFHRL